MYDDEGYICSRIWRAISSYFYLGVTNQTNKMSTSFPLLSNAATLTEPVELVPIFTDPDHNVYPALGPTFDTAIFENVEIAGPRVPICPTGAWMLTIGVLPRENNRFWYGGDDTATVKFTNVVVSDVLCVRDGTMNAED